MSGKIDSVADFGFADPENARNYAESGPASFVPGFSELHRTTIQMLTETAGSDGDVLVLGAGGGHELQAFIKARPDWNMIAVDPAAAMLEEAKQKIGAAAANVQWVEGFIHDAPAMHADAATCLLTLHVIPDDETKIETLKQLRARLKPGGCCALVDNCIDMESADAERWLDRFVQYAVDSGIPGSRSANFGKSSKRLQRPGPPNRKNSFCEQQALKISNSIMSACPGAAG